MGVPFLKMNGLGNDFVVLDARSRALALTPENARALADRRRGIGCDQILVLEKAEGADAFMRIYNAEGGEVDACGNGTRCVARLLAEELARPRVTIRTNAGLLHCEMKGKARATVDMGEPRFDWQDIPLAERMDTRGIDVAVGPIDAPVLKGPSAVSMGNPHCIFFVEDVMAHDLAKIGPMLEHHPMFPERANISLARIESSNRIRLRVWERGTGITSACGTAACATLAAAARKKLSARKAEIELDGGVLEIEWREGDGHILMTGPADINFAGEFDESLLAAPGKAA